MKQKRVLVLGSYPIKNPQHGGQKRTEAIVAAYRKVFASVKYAAIFYKPYYSDYALSDIAVGSVTAKKIERKPIFSDIYCGEAVFEDPKVKNKITKLLLAYHPQVIHVEQPYVYLGLKPLLQELHLNAKLIFGSQNIEYKMKGEIFADVDVEKAEATATLTKIKKLEEEFSRDCAMLAAVSEDDARDHAAMGAKDIVMARNGVGERTSADRGARTNTAWYKENIYKVRRRIVFVGSAHPPNWIGFEKMVGTSLGYVPADTRIYLVGGVADYLAKEISTRKIQDVTFWQRAIHRGRISDRALQRELDLAEIILLPITEGGGSNLKTAEAFLADKKIVATSYAMRSYEYLKDMPNLFVGDTPSEFREAILKALDSEWIARTKEEREIVKRVLWDDCLKDLAARASEL